MMSQVFIKTIPTRRYSGVYTSTAVAANVLLGGLVDLLEFLLRSESGDKMAMDSQTLLRVDIHPNGACVPIGDLLHDRHTWTSFIKPADNFLEQNVSIYLTRSGQLELRSSRRICQNEELFAWFDSSLALMLGIFTVQLNSLANGRYECKSCQTSFKQPNHWKSHYLIYHHRPMQIACRGHDLYSCNPIGLNTSPACLMSSYSIRPDHVIPEEFKMAYCNDIVYDQEIKYDNNNYYRHTIEDKNFGHERIKAGLIKSSLNNNNNTVNSCKSSKASTPDSTQEMENVDPSFPRLKRKDKICKSCGKAFSKRHDLNIHQRSHTREKPLMCRFCNKGYSDPSNLIKHEKKHPQYTNEFQCELCQKSFDGRRKFTNHVKKFHQVLVSGLA